jgi:hypothetical protein
LTEVYDASQVQIGLLPKDIIVGIENTFEINVNKAGHVPLEVIITSSSGTNGKKNRFNKKIFQIRIHLFFFYLISSLQNR